MGGELFVDFGESSGSPFLFDPRIPYNLLPSMPQKTSGSGAEPRKGLYSGKAIILLERLSISYRERAHCFQDVKKSAQIVSIFEFKDTQLAGNEQIPDRHPYWQNKKTDQVAEKQNTTDLLLVSSILIYLNHDQRSWS